MNYFKNYFTKIKETKSFARKKNIGIWFMPIMDSILILYGVSWFFSFHTWIILGDVIGPANSYFTQFIWDISMHLPVIYFGIFTVTVIPKLSRIMIYVHYYLMQMTFKFIEKFDLWYWRKYKKDSILSNAIWRSQSQIMGLDIYAKRKIGFCILFLFGLYALQKLGLLL
jgi:hypothetical protein